MVGDPYDTFDDPYCYTDSHILRNVPDMHDEAALEQFEVEMVAIRAIEDLPELPKGKLRPTYYRKLHHHLFQDVYDWAGKDRTIRTAKGGNPFCYPEYIDKYLRELFDRLDGPEFQQGVAQANFILAAADFLAELNIIHPFREGNGRSQLVFLRLLGLRAGHPFRSESVEPTEFIQAMIDSFGGDLAPLIDELERMQS